MPRGGTVPLICATQGLPLLCISMSPQSAFSMVRSHGEAFRGWMDTGLVEPGVQTCSRGPWQPGTASRVKVLAPTASNCPRSHRESGELGSRVVSQGSSVQPLGDQGRASGGDTRTLSHGGGGTGWSATMAGEVRMLAPSPHTFASPGVCPFGAGGRAEGTKTCMYNICLVGPRRAVCGPT